MDYLFGTLRVDNEMRHTVRIKTAPDETAPVYEPGSYHTHVESYPDVTITDSYKVERQWHAETDSSGNRYVWYVLSEYSRNIDRSPAVQMGVDENRGGINRNSANIDYVAMMADINIPTEAMEASEDAEISTADRMASYAPSGMEGPEMMDAAAHSPKFERVKGYYNAGLWNAEMVHNAVGRWITTAEEQEIISKEG